MRDGIGQGRGPSSGDALPQGDDPGQRVLALPADLGPLDRGASLGPGGVHRLEVEQALVEALLEGGEGFGGGGHGGGSWPMRSFCHPS